MEPFEAVTEFEKGGTGEIEKSSTSFEALIEEAKTSIGEAEKSVKAELDVKSRELAREILDKFSSDITDKQTVVDCLESIKANPTSVENTYKQVRILEGRRSFSGLKGIYESASNSLSSAFDMKSESKTKTSLLDKIKSSIANGTVDETSVEKLKSAVGADMSALDKKATLDGTKDEIESKSSLPWKVLLFLTCCGSLVGALFLVSSALSGCYQYKLEKDAFQLDSCEQFYNNKDNQKYCSCPTGLVTTPDCAGADANYPYCKCPEINGQVCKNGTDIVYYGYTDYNPFTLLKDVVKTVIKDVKAAGDGLGDIITAIKKYALIIGVIILAIVVLNILLKFAPSGGGEHK